MAKEPLADALHGLKELERRRSGKQPGAKPRAQRGRPKAFDPFYLFSLILAALCIGLQAVAMTYYH